MLFGSQNLLSPLAPSSPIEYLRIHILYFNIISLLYSLYILTKVGTVGTLDQYSVFAVPRQGTPVPLSIPTKSLNRTEYVRKYHNVYLDTND